MRLYSVFAKISVSFLFIAATMMAVAIGCENGRDTAAGPMVAGKTNFTVNNSPAADAMFKITKEACGAAFGENFVAFTHERETIIRDAIAGYQQCELAAKKAAPGAYEVLYKTEGGDRQEFMVQDAPEGILTVVTVLVDSEGNLYFFDDPSYPISGSAKKQWIDHQAEARANPGLGDFGENEALANLAKAQAEWAKLKAGQRVVVVPAEISDDGKVLGVHTFQAVTLPKK